MEQTRVVIVGAGPAGLVAGLSLAQHGVTVSSLAVPFPAMIEIADYTMELEYHLGEGKRHRRRSSRSLPRC
jgi:2-polyprenyl-6-methoxyphenol hydroxylase-like FAD-dependent oxidoreductase